MRQITEDAIKAFYKKKNFKRTNTEVYVGEFTTQLRLHGHTIAILHHDGLLEVSTCGYDTNTTRDRLTGLEGVIVRSRKGQLTLNGLNWDGKLTQLF